MLREPLPDAQAIADLWLEATELDADRESLTEFASALYRSEERPPILDKVLTALQKSPRTSSEMLVALGTQAAVSKQFDDARQFLAAAVEKDPSDPIAWNNYGLVLGEGTGADLTAALQAVNHALEFAPEEFRFRETRGQLLLRLERWEEAIEDLEFALNGLPHLSEIHESLATAYAAIGNEHLASMHRQYAD